MFEVYDRIFVWKSRHAVGEFSLNEIAWGVAQNDEYKEITKPMFGKLWII